MLKLMIVDDEFIVRQGMRKIVPWEELGISVVGEAESVEEAVDTAARVFPDIIICDIRLPGGEGFTVIDKIKKFIPWIQVIMITAHSDKEYMLQAIHKGACDYLFKPAGLEDIKRAVMRACDKVYEYQNQMMKDMNYKKLFMENIDILRADFFQNLINGNISRKKALESAGTLKICLDGPFWYLMYLRLHSKDYYETVQQISFRLEEFHPVISALAGRHDEILVLLNSAFASDEGRIYKKVEDLRYVEIQLSASCDSIEKIPELYRQIKERKVSSGEEQQTDKLDNVLQQKQEMLYDAVKYHDSVSELLRLFSDFLETAKQRGLPQKRIVQECSNIMNTVRIFTGIPQNRQQMDPSVENVQRQFEELCEDIQRSENYKLDDISGKALYYIRKKCQKDLTLESVAAELFMSSSYLSRIIKERTGHGFGYWVNYYRIKEAKERLKDSSKSIEQVAYECGYNSYRIFSENFRRYVGKTASAWRMDELGSK